MELLLFYELIMLRLNEVFELIEFLFLLFLVLNKDLSEVIEMLLEYVIVML